MTLSFGLVGAGGIAERHRANLNELDGVTLAAVCDVDESVATRVADAEDATAYTDHETMYDSESLDAVLVCIPPFAHSDEETLAARRGLDVFVEKPVALDRETSDRIAAELEAAGVVTSVGYALRYSEAALRARELVDPEDLSLVEGRYAFPGPPDSEWWRRRDASGGQVVEQSTHVYDMVRYLAGDVAQVTAMGDRRHVDSIDFEDTTVAVMRHESGVVSEVASTVAAPEMDVSLRLTGPDVDLTLDPLANTLDGRVGDEDVDVDGENDAFRDELRAFADAVADDDDDAGPIRSPYAEGCRTLGLTLDVNESLATGEAIER